MNQKESQWVISTISRMVDRKLFGFAPGGRLRLDGPNSGALPNADLPDPLVRNRVFSLIQSIVGAAQSSACVRLEIAGGNEDVVNLILRSSACATGTAVLELYSSSGSLVLSLDKDGDLDRVRGVPYHWPTEQGAAGTFLQNDGSGQLAWSSASATGGGGGSSASDLAPQLYVWQTFTFSQEGNLTAGAKPLRVYVPGAYTIDRVYIAVNTPPAGQAIIVDVNVNGSTIFTSQANRPQIAAGANTGESGAPDVTALAKNDYLTFDIDQVGSATVGADLTVHVRCKQFLTAVA